MKKELWPNMIWQPCVAIIFILMVLLVMNFFSTSDVLWAVGAGSLSSSCYIVFGNPSANSGQPKKIIGGYFIGTVTGLLLQFVSMQFRDYGSAFLGSSHFYQVGILAAFSVGLSLFFMSLLKEEHPPAAGMALVLVIDMHDYYETVIIILAALLLAGIRYVLRDKLVDL